MRNCEACGAETKGFWSHLRLCGLCFVVLQALTSDRLVNVVRWVSLEASNASVARKSSEVGSEVQS